MTGVPNEPCLPSRARWHYAKRDLGGTGLLGDINNNRKEKNMKNVMLDLETMGTGPNAAIVAIGAVEFCLHSFELGKEFYAPIDLKTSVKSGGVIDPSTVLWWMKQSEQARNLFKGTGFDLYSTLASFSSWIEETCGPDVRVWGNGAAFDNVVLGSAYDREGIERPWKFWNDRCYRTVKSMFPHVEMKRTGTHHNALDDAKSQALHLIDIQRDIHFAA